MLVDYLQVKKSAELENKKLPDAREDQFSQERAALGKDNYRELSQKEINLISLIRGTGYGEFKIIIMESQPIRAIKIIRAINL